MTYTTWVSLTTRRLYLLLLTTIYFIVTVVGGSDYWTELTYVYPRVSIPSEFVTHTFTDQAGRSYKTCTMRCRVLLDCQALTVSTNVDGSFTCALTTEDISLVDCHREGNATTILKERKECDNNEFIHVPEVGYLSIHTDVEGCNCGKSWTDANQICSLMDSNLYIPENQDHYDITWEHYMENHTGGKLWTGLKTGEWDKNSKRRNNVSVSGGEGTTYLTISDKGIEEFSPNTKRWFICQKGRN